MIRLTFLAVVFGAGIYSGTRLAWVSMTENCLDAGGQLDTRSVCRGVPE
ncbi:MAG: hypothetical protein KDK29_07125 [Sedimentitalea sp.]|nr:hypothetical protein [Sedimentitalea sp.]